ncbi:quinon protein alcohol dehydrogenase-like superfamily [Crucibulum laeve]|uniref:Quinon protein alcohol dehydrogenase-like superfamily n=1 Tax=Crucibulum laeve TaxID=68775 RepID=A0A5C3LKD7_9AGAR|nr:quinon protein alcohol dehydrogenase-like superfamily [Crucibulum laeve]
MPPLKGHSGRVTCVAYSPNGKHVVSSSWDRTIKVWDAAENGLVLIELSGHTSRVDSVGYSPSGQRVVSSSEDRTVRVWDAVTGVPLMQPLTQHNCAARNVVYSPDGSRLIAGNGEAIWVWDAESGEMLMKGPPVSVLGSWPLCISPDGLKVVTGTIEGLLYLWNPERDRPIAQISFTQTSSLGQREINALAFMPNNQHIIAGSGDNSVHFVDTLRNSHDFDHNIIQALAGHTNAILSVCCTSDGRHVVSSSSDNTIIIWNVGEGFGRKDWFLEQSAAAAPKLRQAEVQVDSKNDASSVLSHNLEEPNEEGVEDEVFEQPERINQEPKETAGEAQLMEQKEEELPMEVEGSSQTNSDNKAELSDQKDSVPVDGLNNSCLDKMSDRSGAASVVESVAAGRTRYQDLLLQTEDFSSSSDHESRYPSQSSKTRPPQNNGGPSASEGVLKKVFCGCF